MKWIYSRHILGAAGVTLSIFGVYLLSYLIVWAFISPVQAFFFPGLAPFASFLFLPHGIRVLATSLLGRHAVPGLIAAELAGNYAFWGLPNMMTLTAVSAISGGVTWLAFAGLRKLGIDAFYLEAGARPPPFQTLLLAAITAAVANAFLVTSILEGPTQEHVTLVLAAIVTGDVTGFLAVVMAAKSVLPLLNAKPD